MKKELQLKSGCDGRSLHVWLVEPDEKPYRGIVQLSHGMAEHGGRYLQFMEYLAAQGYVSVIHDHRGHGESVDKQEDWGYFYDETAEYIVEDLHRVSLYIMEAYPKLPLILFGHSMGTLVVRCYLKKYDNIPQCVVLCGAPCKNGAVSVALVLEKMIEKCKGADYRSPLLYSLALGSYDKAFAAEGPGAWISTNRENLAAYAKDPGCGFRFTANGYRNLFLLLKRTYEKSGWQMKQPALPILFIAGSDDPVIGSPQKFLQSAGFLRARGYKNVETKLYEGKRHELLQEDIREQVYADVCSWMKRKQE